MTQVDLKKMRESHSGMPESPSPFDEKYHKENQVLLFSRVLGQRVADPRTKSW